MFHETDRSLDDNLGSSKENTESIVQKLSSLVDRVENSVEKPGSRLEPGPAYNSDKLQESSPSFCRKKENKFDGERNCLVTHSEFSSSSHLPKYTHESINQYDRQDQFPPRIIEEQRSDSRLSQRSLSPLSVGPIPSPLDEVQVDKAEDSFEKMYKENIEGHTEQLADLSSKQSISFRYSFPF